MNTKKTESKIIGRKKEIAILKGLLQSKKSELIALYGRRRIGKTFLINEFFKNETSLNFYITGIRNGSKETQLSIFQNELEEKFYNKKKLPLISSWMEAFKQLSICLKSINQKNDDKVILIFIDELPWLATPKSGLLESLDYIWNTDFKNNSQIKCVLCGSAASWMIKKIIHAKGGLHNRLTGSIHLMPFNLCETREFLKYKNLDYNNQQVIEAYMALGGVPYYLDLFKRGLSASQNIAELAFGSGLLADEFKKLFSSLFEESSQHTKIVQVLALKNKGFTREDLLKKTNLPSGGKFSEWLNELEEAGFIENITTFSHKTKQSLYRITDEFLWFHFKWQKKAPRGIFKTDAYNYWIQQLNTPRFNTWAGYAFENICLKHHLQIKSALGFQSIYSEVSQWSSSEVQIDLLYDRADKTIILCEIKYEKGNFVLQKKYAEELIKKRELFKRATKTKKNILIALITLEDLTRNIYTQEIISLHAKSEDLFLF